jgi:hypothetical protein
MRFHFHTKAIYFHTKNFLEKHKSIVQSKLHLNFDSPILKSMTMTEIKNKKSVMQAKVQKHAEENLHSQHIQ